MERVGTPRGMPLQCFQFNHLRSFVLQSQCFRWKGGPKVANATSHFIEDASSHQDEDCATQNSNNGNLNDYSIQ